MRDLESQRQAWIIFAAFKRVHRLAGHVEALGKIGLRPGFFGAQIFKMVFQRSALRDQDTADGAPERDQERPEPQHVPFKVKNAERL